MRQGIPYLQVRHDCIICYELSVDAPRRSEAQKLACVGNVRQIAYAGAMSPGSMKRIRSAVDILLQKSPERIIWNPVTSKFFPFTVNFITLTISGKRNVGIKEGYETLLKPFLRKLRKGQFSYVWKAEYQKRGQLHYHLTTNQYHRYDDIRKIWNELQRRNGHLDAYAEMAGHYNANSTDVHAVYKIKNIAAYLSKYLSKTEPIPASAVIEKGKVWDCSIDLKVKRFAVEEDSENTKKIYEAEKEKKVESLYLDTCKIIKIKSPVELLTDTQKADYKNWLK